MIQNKFFLCGGMALRNDESEAPFISICQATVGGRSGVQPTHLEIVIRSALVTAPSPCISTGQAMPKRLDSRPPLHTCSLTCKYTKEATSHLPPISQTRLFSTRITISNEVLMTGPYILSRNTQLQHHVPGFKKH